MDAKKVIIALVCMVFLASSASAILTASYNSPAANSTLAWKVTQADKCTDFNINVTDTNTDNSTHVLSLYYDTSDANTYITTDLNLSTSNCTFNQSVGDNVWTAPGPDCMVPSHCWADSKPVNATYTFDTNAYSTGLLDANRYVGHAIMKLTLDDRVLSSGATSMLGNIELILAAALIFFLLAVGYIFRDRMTPAMLATMLVGAVFVFLIILIIAELV